MQDSKCEQTSRATEEIKIKKMDGKTPSEIQSEANADDNEGKAARKEQEVKKPSADNDNEPEPYDIYPHWEEARIILGLSPAEERHVHLKSRKPLDAANIKIIDWDETWRPFFDLETEVVEYLDWFEEMMSADGQADEDDEGSPDDMGCQHESVIPDEDQDEAATKVKNRDETSIAVTSQHETAMTQDESDIAVGNHFERAIIEGNRNETFITVSDEVKTETSVDNRDQNSITVDNQDQNAITVGHQVPNSIIIGNQAEKTIVVRNQEEISSTVGNRIEKAIPVVNPYETSKDEIEINECSQDGTTTAASNQSEAANTIGYHDKATSTGSSYGRKSNMLCDAASLSPNIDDCAPEKYCNDEKLVNEDNQSSSYENNATVRLRDVKLSNVEKFKLLIAEFSSAAYKYMWAFSGTTYNWMKNGSEKSHNGRLVKQTGTDTTDSTMISENQPAPFTSRAESKLSPINSYFHSHANNGNTSVAFDPQNKSVTNDQSSTLSSDGSDISTHFPKVATRTSFNSERSVTCSEADVTESASSNDSNSMEKNLTKTGSNLRRFTNPSPVSSNSDSFKFSDDRRVETAEFVREHDMDASTAVENQDNVSRENIVQYTDCFGKVFTEEDLALLLRIIRENITSHFRRFVRNVDKLFDFVEYHFEIIENHVEHDTDMSKDLDLMICHLYDLQLFLAHLVDLGVGYCTRVRKLLKDMRSEYSQLVHEDYEGFLKDFLSYLEKFIIIISELKDFFLQIFEIVDCCNH